jgi:hypothetical protein
MKNENERRKRHEMMSLSMRMVQEWSKTGDNKQNIISGDYYESLNFDQMKIVLFFDSSSQY